MKDQFRFAVVGCGAIGRVHAGAIKKVPGAQLVAVSDLNAENCAKFAREFGCHAYTDFREMFQKEQIQIACICTPSGTRLSICEAAAEHCVHLLVEKPLDIQPDRLGKIISVCRSTGIKLGCVFQLRFLPVFQALKRAEREGRFGKLIVGNAGTICYRSAEYYQNGGWRGTYAQDGGGALMNQGIHNIDLLRWIMGDVESVTAYQGHLSHEIEVEDTIVASIRFANGAMGTLAASTSVYYGINKKLEIFGTDGSAIIKDIEPVMWQFQQSREGEWERLQQDLPAHPSLQPTSPLVEDTWAHQQQIADMIEAVREDREPAVNGIDAQKTVKLVLAIYEAARTGQRIYLSAAQ
jgi:UDP-N-acetyl-2-amino-2-deoxyglucuronate dehydrogenase